MPKGHLCHREHRSKACAVHQERSSKFRGKPEDRQRNQRPQNWQEERSSKLSRKHPRRAGGGSRNRFWSGKFTVSLGFWFKAGDLVLSKWMSGIRVMLAPGSAKASISFISGKKSLRGESGARLSSKWRDSKNLLEILKLEDCLLSRSFSLVGLEGNKAGGKPAGSRIWVANHLRSVMAFPLVVVNWAACDTYSAQAISDEMWGDRGSYSLWETIALLLDFVIDEKFGLAPMICKHSRGFYP
ncbi:hypothetical protein Tco_0653827 [Tanacetum coccineum]|uniref:Uncharacterized protein n=1 Tax=Tanacetum coccineum TaxID=301880 RepID=A0ABQ4X1V1_9ASTR